jgi:phage terminase large subunit GpA-like protein
MRPRCAVFDAYGSAGFTDRAYAAWLSWRQKGLVKRHGKIDGRDAWNLLPSKGEGGASGRLQVVYPDARADRRAAAKGQVPVALFNTDSAKDDLSGQLARGMPGPGYVNLPAGLVEQTPDFYDQATAETRSRAGRWSKKTDGVRNEVLDLLVGTHVAARLHGIRRMKWDHPPAWAAEWDSNSLVFMPEAVTEPAGPLPASVAATVGLTAIVATQTGPRVSTQTGEPKGRRYA